MSMKLKDMEQELADTRKRNDDERDELLNEKLERERVSDEQLEQARTELQQVQKNLEVRDR